MNFRMGFSISTEVIEISYMDYIESVDCFDILSLEVHEHDVCVYVIFNFFSSVFYSVCMSRYFILFRAVVNGIVFFIFLSVFIVGV